MPIAVAPAPNGVDAGAVVEERRDVGRRVIRHEQPNKSVQVSSRYNQRRELSAVGRCRSLPAFHRARVVRLVTHAESVPRRALGEQPKALCPSFWGDFLPGATSRGGLGGGSHPYPSYINGLAWQALPAGSPTPTTQGGEGVTLCRMGNRVGQALGQQPMGLTNLNFSVRKVPRPEMVFRFVRVLRKQQCCAIRTPCQRQTSCWCAITEH